MAQPGLEWQGAVKRRIGLKGDLDFTMTRVAMTLRLPCSRGHIVPVDVSPHKPPEYIAAKLVREGWTIGSRMVCPKHSRKRKPEREQAPEEEEIMAETPKPSDAARAKKREAMDLLTMAFKIAPDGKTGRYEDGYSDAWVAKETGLAEALIVTMREDFFAPLGEPKELSEFRNSVAECRRHVEASNAAALEAVAKLEMRLTGIVAKLGLKE